MLLQDKVAVVYGAAGDVGGAVARAFAREGARVFLAGRTMTSLDAVAREIIAAGGQAEVAPVDALDEDAVDRHAEAIFATAGSIDISFNCIELGDTQGKPILEMKVEDFVRPIEAAGRTQFLTATAAGRRMAKKGSGVVMAITANVARTTAPNVGGFGAACALIEGICRQLTVELGPSGIRVVCLRSGGSADTRGVGEVLKLHSSIAGITPEELEKSWTKDIPLRRLSRIAEVANAAVLMASDYASAVTGEVTNVTCGALQD